MSNAGSVVLFDWVLLRKSVRDLWVVKATYRAMLLSLIAVWHDNGEITKVDGAKLLGKLLGKFIDACMCFVELMNIDYANYVTQCAGQLRLVFDAVEVNIQSLAANILNPERATPSRTDDESARRLRCPDRCDLIFLTLGNLGVVTDAQKRSLLRAKTLLLEFCKTSRFNKRTGDGQ
jgi:hypothetical protein